MRSGFGEDGLETLGEGLGEEGFVGPAGDELVSEGVACCGFECAAIKAGGSAGVLRGEAEDARVAYAVDLHLRDRLGDEGMPVAHADVDPGSGLFFEELGLAEGPAGEGRAGG